MQEIQARAEVVDQGWVERVGVAQGALLGEGRLCALLETTTVRYAAENAGNKLGMVDDVPELGAEPG